MVYDGFRISCGCTCSRCGSTVILEGYSDAGGAHYCPRCDDYVGVSNVACKARTPEAIQRREKVIKEAGADKE
jgi:hypothetical protein